MPRATVNAKEFVKDIRSGKSDDELMRLHGLTSKQFRAVCRTLLEAGKLRATDLGEGPTTSDFTFGVASTCPHCGAMKLADSGLCPECGEPTTRVVTGDEPLNIDFPDDIHDPEVAPPADTPDQPSAGPQEVEIKPAPSQPAPQSGVIEVAANEASVAAHHDSPQIEARRPSQLRRIISISLATTLAAGAIVFVAGWYTGFIALPFVQGPDAPDVLAMKPAPPAPAAGKPAKAPASADEVKPLAPAVEVKPPSPPVAPPQIAQTALSAAAATPPPAVAPVSPASEKAGPKPLQESPAGAPDKSVTETPPAVADTTPPPPSTPTPVSIAAETPAKPTHPVPERGPAPETPYQKGPAGVVAPQPPDTLAAAVRARDIAAVRKCLDRDDNVNTRDEDGITPCMLAAAQGDADMMALLIERGANVNATDSMGSTALSLALESGNSRVITMLLARDRGKGAAELLEACRAGRGDVVKALLQYGANPNSQDEEGNTPLMLAVGAGDLPLVKMLLDRGADTNARNHQGVTALAWAYSSPLSEAASLRVRREIVQLLKQHGTKSRGPTNPVE